MRDASGSDDCYRRRVNTGLTTECGRPIANGGTGTGAGLSDMRYFSFHFARWANWYYRLLPAELRLYARRNFWVKKSGLR